MCSPHLRAHHRSRLAACHQRPATCLAPGPNPSARPLPTLLCISCEWEQAAQLLLTRGLLQRPGGGERAVIAAGDHAAANEQSREHAATAAQTIGTDKRRETLSSFCRYILLWQQHEGCWCDRDDPAAAPCACSSAQRIALHLTLSDPRLNHSDRQLRACTWRMSSSHARKVRQNNANSRSSTRVRVRQKRRPCFGGNPRPPHAQLVLYTYTCLALYTCIHI